MKIGIDCRLWSETGVGRYIRNLVLNLQKIDEKNEYTLFILEKNKDQILKQVQNDKFKIIEADIHWHTFEEQIKLLQILNGENLDLMHFPYHSVPIFYNKSFVLTIHDLIPYNFPTGKASALPLFLYWLKFFVYKYVLRNATKKAKKIIAVSNTTKDEIVNRLKINPEKITVTHEGASDKISKPGLSSRIQTGLVDSKYFLYVGNAFPHKNLERLLEAFSLFCHPELLPAIALLRQLQAGVSGSHLKRDSDLRQNDTRLVLISKEDYFYKRLKKKAQDLNLSDKVIFLQNVNDEELSGLYKNAIALMMPSLMEGFGLPALEAMANRCLVLASNIPALQETCGDSAIYFVPHNINDIAEKMSNVYLNNIYHLSEKKEKGLERVKLFSWRKMAEETLAVYEQAIAKLKKNRRNDI